MAITKSAMLRKVRQRLKEPNPVNWTDEDLADWANDAARDICRRAECLRDIATITTTVDVDTYDFPADMIRIHLVEFVFDGSNRINQLQYLDRHNFNIQLERSGWPEYWTSWGATTTTLSTNALRIFPAPSDDGELRVYYYRMPADVSIVPGVDNTDIYDIPDGWDDVLVDFVESRALRQDRDPRWQEAKAMYEENLGALVQATDRYTDQAGQWAGGRGMGLPDWLVSG